MSHTPSPLLTLHDIATQPRWSLDQLLALPGHCAGGLLRDWSTHVNRRWGHQAEAQIRAQLGPLDHQLPSLPTEKEWLPVACQLRTTDVIIEQFLDGDALPLEELLWEDSQRNSKPAAKRLLQWVGPAILLRQTPQIHRHMYDVGQVQVDVSRLEATLTFTDSPLFANPTWQLLSCFGIRLFLRSVNCQTKRLTGQITSPTSFQLITSWTR